jgi:hypothetical protein
VREVRPLGLVEGVTASSRAKAECSENVERERYWQADSNRTNNRRPIFHPSESLTTRSSDCETRLTILLLVTFPNAGPGDADSRLALSRVTGVLY